jgi:hypothetical protein
VGKFYGYQAGGDRGEVAMAANAIGGIRSEGVTVVVEVMMPTLDKKSSIPGGGQPGQAQP